MVPFVRGEILSQITRFEPPEFLEEDFHGTGMEGHLAYQFRPEAQGTTLIQRETVRWKGWQRPFERWIGAMLRRQCQKRLEGIKAVLESGWKVNP